MLNQVVPLGERFITFLALIRLLSSVDFPIDTQKLSLAKGFSAFDALIRAFSTVNSLMFN